MVTDAVLRPRRLHGPLGAQRPRGDRRLPPPLLRRRPQGGRVRRRHRREVHRRRRGRGLRRALAARGRRRARGACRPAPSRRDRRPAGDRRRAGGGSRGGQYWRGARAPQRRPLERRGLPHRGRGQCGGSSPVGGPADGRRRRRVNARGHGAGLLLRRLSPGHPQGQEPASLRLDRQRASGPYRLGAAQLLDELRRARRGARRPAGGARRSHEWAQSAFRADLRRAGDRQEPPARRVRPPPRGSARTRHLAPGPMPTLRVERHLLGPLRDRQKLCWHPRERRRGAKRGSSGNHPACR